MRRTVLAIALVVAPAAAPASPPEDDAADAADDLGVPLPAPPGFRPYPTDEHGTPRGPFRCGDADVTVETTGDMDAGTVRLRVVRGGRVVFARALRTEGAFGPRFAPLWCHDVTGDGTPELLYSQEYGGSHCCNVETLLTLTERPRVLLHFDDHGRGGLIRPLDLGTGAPYPLIAYVDSEGPVYRPLCGSHADRPFLPLVYALRQGRYARASRRHPDVLRSIRARAQRRVAEATQDGELSPFFCQEPFEIMTTSLALGDWRAVRATLPPELLPMLDSARRDVHRLTAER